MKTVRELIKEAESKLDDEHKDVNVAKVLFYHLAKKEPHEPGVDILVDEG